QFEGGGALQGTHTLELPIAGRAGVSASAATVVLNVTVVGPLGPGFVTVYPCGVTRPTASNLNFSPGQTIPNAVFSKVGAGGWISLTPHAARHLPVGVARRARRAGGGGGGPRPPARRDRFDPFARRLRIDPPPARKCPCSSTPALLSEIRKSSIAAAGSRCWC